MSLQMMKRSMSRMLRQSIIDLCRNSVGAEGYVEIDGIVCITIGEDESEEIVVKVHEILGEEDDHYLPPRSIPPPTSQAPQRNVQIAIGRPRMQPSTTVTSSGMGPKQSYTSSSGRSGPMYTQAGGQRGAPGPPAAHHREDQRSGAPSKTPQEPKKQPQPQQPLMDSSVIKIEIDSDDESVDGPSPSNASGRKGTGRASSLVCNVCDQSVPTVKALKQHVRESHGAVVCEICWQPFLTKADLDQHMKTHDKNQSQHAPAAGPRHDGAKGDVKKEGNERFKCGVCGNTSDARQAMVDHLRSGHEFQGCYTCMLCREYFPNKPTFTIHRKLSHPAASDVTCQTCGVGLERKEFDTHRKECTADETPKKGKKQKQDSPKGPVSKRSRMDSPSPAAARGKKAVPASFGDSKHLECPICCQILENFSVYERHMSSVHGRLVCSICAGTLKNGRAAQQHMKRHTDQLPYTCDKCNMGNQSHLQLRRHMVVFHDHMPAFFTCPQCNVYIDSRQDFTSHMKDKHKVDFMDDDELENYVVFEDDAEDDDMYNPEDDEEDGEDYMDEENYNQNHGRLDPNTGLPYPGEVHDDYNMDEADYEEGIGGEEDLVTCNICELAMPSLSSLKDHISTVHHAVVCEICWKPFLSQAELGDHIRTSHSEVKDTSGRRTPGGKQSTPTTSAASATTPSKSGNHSASNSKTITNFKCGVCGSATEGRKSMVEHLKTAHEFLGCFTCLLCGEFFPNKPTFTIHRKLSHGNANEKTCNTCGVGLMRHEYDQHILECEGSGIDIKDAEWDGKKEKKQDK